MLTQYPGFRNLKILKHTKCLKLGKHCKVERQRKSKTRKLLASIFVADYRNARRLSFSTLVRVDHSSFLSDDTGITAEQSQRAVRQSELR